MRCSDAHKASTRLKVIQSASALFTSKGYAATSIDEIMRRCGLTRGGFYAYFSSKGELYREAFHYAASHSEPGDARADETAEDGWIESILDQYLGAQSRAAFLATDLASREAAVRAAYTGAFSAMSARIRARSSIHAPCDEEVALSLAAMIVGAAAIAQTTDDVTLRTKLFASCRKHATTLLADQHRYRPYTFFWAMQGEGCESA